jgi:hypothetical protein
VLDCTCADPRLRHPRGRRLRPALRQRLDPLTAIARESVRTRSDNDLNPTISLAIAGSAPRHLGQYVLHRVDQLTTRDSVVRFVLRISLKMRSHAM